MIGNKLGFQQMTITLLVLLFSVVLAGTVWGYGDGGGGGDGGSGGDSSGSVFTGYTSDQLRDIYGFGFRVGASPIQ